MNDDDTLIRERRARRAVAELSHASGGEAVIVILCDRHGNFTISGRHPDGDRGIAALLHAADRRTREVVGS